MKLTIELVPKTAWFSNIRSHVSKSDWEKIKKVTFTRANHLCEICGGKGPKWPVECHEVWEYDDTNKTQTLLRTIALCPACHRAKHMGLQLKLGTFEATVRHFTKVNGLTKERAEDYIFKAFEQHGKRSKHKWELDISWLTKKFPNIQISEA